MGHSLILQSRHCTHAARLTGFSMRLVGEIERGKEHVAADKLLRLLDVLNMTMTVHVEGK